jgi:BioD-like phosphotransacetylase family protein
MEKPKLYVSATRQNDGKTTTSLGLLSVIGDMFPKVGYIKPVGQQVKLIGDHEIDKDASLMNKVYHIGGELRDMSPIAVPKGFTEHYILHGEVDELRNKIRNAYKNASKGRDFMIVEGTGHAGVGSVLDLSNAAVAKLLNAPVIIVTSGGIGRPIDEVMLNKAVYDLKGVEVIGVIVNKVIPDKYDKVNKMVRLGFQRKGIEVLGVIPFFPVLSSPTISQILEDTKGELICGHKYMEETVGKIIVGAMNPHSFLDYFTGDVLLITPGDREDLILTAITSNMPTVNGNQGIKGIVLTGGMLPHKSVMRVVEKTNIPLILVKEDTFTIARRITNLTIKIKAGDTEKIMKVKEMIKEYVNVDTIMERLQDFNKKPARIE